MNLKHQKRNSLKRKIRSDSCHAIVFQGKKWLGETVTTMLIQYNPRLLLNRTHFHALSIGHLLEYLSNLSNDREKEKAWLDMRDALYNGALFRWLKSMGWESGKIESMQELIKPYDFMYGMLGKVTETLFETIQLESKKKLQNYLQNQSKKEKDSKSYDQPIIGKNWVITLSEKPKVKMELVWVTVEKDGKPYDFYMGSENEEDDAKPVHKVNLTHGYWIGKYPLTQEQWDAIGVKREEQNSFLGKGRPVESVSWDDAKNYCKRLQEMFQVQLQNLIRGKGGKKIHYEFDLPTEAQWEFAAKGGVQSKGYEYSGSDDIGEVAWYRVNSGEELLDENDFWGSIDNACQIHPVGQKMPNELGIHDMSGNVWEWCRDWYGEYSDKEQTDPTGPEDGWSRVIRGGSWGDPAGNCRPSYRNYLGPSFRDLSMGFRVALVPVQ